MEKSETELIVAIDKLTHMLGYGANKISCMMLDGEVAWTFHTTYRPGMFAWTHPTSKVLLDRVYGTLKDEALRHRSAINSLFDL